MLSKPTDPPGDQEVGLQTLNPPSWGQVSVTVAAVHNERRGRPG